MSGYYNEDDLPRFGEMGKNAPELWGEVQRVVRRGLSGGRSEPTREVSDCSGRSPMRCNAPIASTPYTQESLEKGSNLEQMTEAVHVGRGPSRAARRSSTACRCAIRRSIEHVGDRGYESRQRAAFPASGGGATAHLEQPRRPQPATAVRRRPGGKRAASLGGDRHRKSFRSNAGKLCNQTCKHCHVDAGPDRTEENMTPRDVRVVSRRDPQARPPEGRYHGRRAGAQPRTFAGSSSRSGASAAMSWTAAISRSSPCARRAASPSFWRAIGSR